MNLEILKNTIFLPIQVVVIVVGGRYYYYYYYYYYNPGKFGKKNPKYSKNPKSFENFPVDPGRSLGFPGRPTDFLNFSKLFNLCPNF